MPYRSAWFLREDRGKDRKKEPCRRAVNEQKSTKNFVAVGLQSGKLFLHDDCLWIMPLRRVANGFGYGPNILNSSCVWGEERHFSEKRIVRDDRKTITL